MKYRQPNSTERFAFYYDARSLVGVDVKRIYEDGEILGIRRFYPPTNKTRDRARHGAETPPEVVRLRPEFFVESLDEVDFIEREVLRAATRWAAAERRARTLFYNRLAKIVRRYQESERIPRRRRTSS